MSEAASLVALICASFSHAFRWSTTNQLSFSSSLLVLQEGVSFFLKGFIFSQSIQMVIDAFLRYLK